MNPNLTDLTVVLDRSGSMHAVRADAEGGLNAFIAEQKARPGEATFTLCQFDTDYEFVHNAIPIALVPQCKLLPRGGTALLDAVGRCIVETGERLKKIPDKDRPGLVVFVIITDGHENSSKEYTKDRIKKMIEHQQSIYKWQFTFLGANQDAFAEAGSMGIPVACAMNYADEKTSGVFRAAAGNVSRMRDAVASGDTVKNAYTDEERKSVEK